MPVRWLLTNVYMVVGAVTSITGLCRDEDPRMIGVMTVLRSIVALVALAAGACGFPGVGPDGGDDGVPLTVGFSLSMSLEDESSGDLLIEVELSRPATGPVTVGYVTGAGTATRELDFTSGDGSVLFPAGETVATIPVTIIADAVEEANETIVIELRTPSQGTIGVGTHTMTINANVLPRLRVTMTTSSDDEDADATYEIELVNLLGDRITSPLDVSFDYTLSGTAMLGEDYDLANGNVTIPSADMTATVTLPVLDDALDEDPEDATLTISNSTAAVIVLIADEHAHTIVDNDAEPFIGFMLGASTQDEFTTSGMVAVTLSPVSGRQVTVNYAFTAGGSTATSPADITVVSGTLTFAAGVTTDTVSYTLMNDMLDEFDETARIQLTAPTNAQPGTMLHTVTIIDEDPLSTVEFTTTSTPPFSETTTPVMLTVQLNTPSGKPITVPFAEGPTSSPYMNNPGDYSFSTPGPLMIPAGVMTASFMVNVVEDSLDEIDEILAVDLGTPTNANLGTNTRHTLTINNDGDPLPVVQWGPPGDGSVDEPDSGTVQYTYTVVLNMPSGQDVSVDIAFTGDAVMGPAPDDYTVVPGDDPVDFVAGVTSTSVRINIVGDTLAEMGPEDRVIMTLQSPVNALLGATIVRNHDIVDDD